MRKIESAAGKRGATAQPVREDVKSILVIRLNRLGDMVCTIPLLKTLRREFPHSRISVLAESTNADILKGASYLDDVFIYRKKKGMIRNKFIEIRRILKGAEFDLCIGVKAGFSSSLAIMAFLSRAKFRVGYVSARFHLANMLYNIPVNKSGTGQHQILQCLDLLPAIGVPAERFVLDCTMDPSAQADDSFSHFLKSNDIPGSAKLAVINISNNRTSAEWPAENFIRLINCMGAKNIRCLITSDPADGDRAAIIIKACGGSAVYYKTPHIMDFASAVKRADILVCHDSGAMHIGAAAGTKTLVLVGRGITPEVWGPYGEGHRCLVKKSIADINPEEVINEALSMMNVAGIANGG
jgi:ADP-heptose:LPS heptosyltransferase